MAMFLTSNNISEEDIYSKGESISFPDSVKQLFRGDLGQPYGGFPKELQKIILKDEKAYTEKPNAHLKPIDFEKELADFRTKYDQSLSIEDFLSYKMYPKVFDEFYKFRKHFGEVEHLPTPAFYYPLKPNEEIMVSLRPGKNILIRFKHMSEPNEDGIREVFFQFNGQTRNLTVKDNSIKVLKASNYKVSKENEIGAPLQGKLVSILVKNGDEVQKNQPLFVIEAMKMESTVVAPMNGIVNKVYLENNSMIEQDDCVISLN
jgi:pyruvate carboxylase